MNKRKREIFLLTHFSQSPKEQRELYKYIQSKDYEAPETLIRKWELFKTQNHESKFKELEEENLTLITIEDESYPALLKEIYDPPLCLFVKGQLHELPFVSIVGPRKPTEYGLTITKRFAQEIATRNFGIISGMAHGIDETAHREAVNQNKYTIGVLAHGHKHMTRRQQRLAKDILQTGGAVISEYPPSTPPEKFRFPVRNRIIAGLSKYTLIPEATKKSGTRITAAIALRENREILTVPGPITSPQSEGTNEMIAQGAICIYSISSLLQALGINETQKPAKLQTKTMSLEEIMEQENLGISEVFTYIAAQKAKGTLQELPGNRFQINTE